MKKQGFYSAGEFMKLTHITKKTIRYYDEHNILKPSYVDPVTRTRFYTGADLAKLQQILLLKNLGFSLSDIKEITINDADSHFLRESLNLQLRLVEDRIEQLQVVAQTIKDTTRLLDEHKQVDWNQMLNLIHLLGLESSMKKQYQNASNISTRISLHTHYSQNKQGWFPWIYEQCKIQQDMHMLELGCGDGTFWTENKEKIPTQLLVNLTDISDGMLRDAKRAIGAQDTRFRYTVCGCERIPFGDDSFDLILANHVLFYCDDLEQVCEEIKRVLKPNGVFICSTYGQNHMKEISRLVTDFDDRIVLAAENLYDVFGKENGMTLLSKHFSNVTWKMYPDSLLVTDAEPVISYVLSCHGNQNQYILDRYKEFQNYVSEHTENGFYITKEAGIFVCHK